MSPAMARNREDLPVPLRPTRPTRARSGICAVARSIRSRPATRSETSSITSMELNERIPVACATHQSPKQWAAPVPAAVGKNGGWDACVSAPVANATLDNDNRAQIRIRWNGENMCVAGCEAKVRAALSRRGFFTGAAAAGFAATAVPAPAAETRSFSKVVDLTHTMSPDFPTFLGKPGIEMEREFEFKKDRFNLFWWHIIEHAGTHLDAPIHFSESGLSAEKLAVEQLVVPLVVVNVVYQAEQDADYLLSREDLAKWEVKHGRLPAGCCVAMHSGWGELVAADPARFEGRDVNGTMHFPGFAPETAA